MGAKRSNEIILSLPICW